MSTEGGAAAAGRPTPLVETRTITAFDGSPVDGYTLLLLSALFFTRFVREAFIFRSSSYLVFRSTALALCAFTLLSSARGLVPGLCATLAAAEARAEKVEAHACCQVRGAQASPSGASPRVAASENKNPDCALCYLAKGMLKAEPSVAPPRVNVCALPAPPARLCTLFQVRVGNCSRPRDPPHGELA